MKAWSAVITSLSEVMVMSNAASEFDALVDFIRKETGCQKKTIEKVLNAETRYLIKIGVFVAKDKTNKD